MEQILLIDNNNYLHNFLFSTLSSSKYDIISVRSLNSAVQILRSDHPIVCIIFNINLDIEKNDKYYNWILNVDRIKEIPVIAIDYFGNNSNHCHIKQNYLKVGVDKFVNLPDDIYLLPELIDMSIYKQNELKHQQVKIEHSKETLYLLTKAKFQIKTIEEAHMLSEYIANLNPKNVNLHYISELLVNAIEHGNLGIGYDLKSDLIDKNILNDEIKNRLALPENKNKKAEVSIKQSEKQITVLVSDDGDGFDFTKYLTFDEKRLLDNHGRGVAMANSFLKVKYFGKGNVVSVIFDLD